MRRRVAEIVTPLLFVLPAGLVMFWLLAYPLGEVLHLSLSDMVGIAGSQTRLVQSLGVVSAGLLLSMIPPLLIFVFFQRSLTRGLTAGALK